MSAFKYDHDPEARRSTLTVDLCRLDHSNDLVVFGRGALHGDVVPLVLSDEEAIELYELLRANWAGYVAERDEARAMPWKLRESMAEARAEESMADFGHPFDGDPDLGRDLERGK